VDNVLFQNKMWFIFQIKPKRYGKWLPLTYTSGKSRKFSFAKYNNVEIEICAETNITGMKGCFCRYYYKTSVSSNYDFTASMTTYFSNKVTTLSNTPNFWGNSLYLKTRGLEPITITQQLTSSMENYDNSLIISGTTMDTSGKDVKKT